MRSVVIAFVLVVGLAWLAFDVAAMVWDGSHHTAIRGAGSQTRVEVSVPPPFGLYAVGSGLAALAGAGWYLRRRK